MRALIQRVNWARVDVGGSTIGSTGKGILVLLGVALSDGEKDAKYLSSKTVSLRIFEDDEGKMNLSVRDTGGEIMVVSQFTLLADTRKGNRPGFGAAALPETAEPLYELFVRELRDLGLKVQTGAFGARMKVSLENDGPVTILLESK
ncbi:MAG: D-tyrosyl-tRNA(Tyr) deacylase [bacterium]|nr:MAG: D-tyrosyl-tRNA(Tyr) deacylase [bacterium]